MTRWPPSRPSKSTTGTGTHRFCPPAKGSSRRSGSGTRASFADSVSLVSPFQAEPGDRVQAGDGAQPSGGGMGLRTHQNQHADHVRRPCQRRGRGGGAFAWFLNTQTSLFLLLQVRAERVGLEGEGKAGGDERREGLVPPGQGRRLQPPGLLPLPVRRGMRGGGFILVMRANALTRSFKTTAVPSFSCCSLYCRELVN